MRGTASQNISQPISIELGDCQPGLKVTSVNSGEWLIEMIAK